MTLLLYDLILSSPEVPEYTIIAEPSEGHPTFLLAEISLPKVVSNFVLAILVSEGPCRLYFILFFLLHKCFLEKKVSQHTILKTAKKQSKEETCMEHTYRTVIIGMGICLYR